MPKMLRLQATKAVKNAKMFTNPNKPIFLLVVNNIELHFYIIFGICTTAHTTPLPY